MKSLLLFSLIAVACAAQKIRFDNYRVYSAEAANSDQLKILQDLQSAAGVIFWEEPKTLFSKVNIALPPAQVADFLSLTEDAQIKTKLEIENLQDLIDREKPRRSGKADFDWTEFHDVDEIYAWLDGVAAAHPEKITILDIGESYEGRKIKMVKISQKEGNRGIFIETNIHAREWVTSATVTFLINELLTSEDPEIVDLAQNVDWHIIPLANPDGFQYSHDVDRMWRSTRSKVHSKLCSGADPNRNFDFKWMQVPGGASAVKCSYTYAGPHALSEVETKTTDNYLKEHSKEFDVYLAFHSYSQLILLSYGDGEKPENYDEQLAIAEESAEWISRRFGTIYEVGNTKEILYATSGTSSDHALYVYGIPVSYTYEMRPAGAPGFLLPKEEIIPNALEIVDGMKGLVFKAREFGYLGTS